MTGTLRTTATVVGAVALVAVSAISPARAVPSPSPPVKYSQTTKCVTTANTRSTLKSGVSWAQRQLDYTALWKLGERGAGETIAVIDTGVNPVSALAGRLLPGGDYVRPNGDGLSDCDGHGTVVAGIIAAAPDSQTGYSGVAPSAQILPIRQSSNYYGVKNAKAGSAQATAGTTTTLAEAIRYATDQDVNVINISEASCRNTNSAPDPAVQSAVDYAVRHDVVVVAAAGNVDQSTPCNQQNIPGRDPVTFPTPAEAKGVLAVAAVDQDRNPAPFSLTGPWVGVAAPGENIVATNPVAGSTGQINEFITSSGVSSIQGTSFAAPYVAALAALVQERFPHLKPHGVVQRIEATAEHPAAPGGRNDFVGYGMINPRAALTALVPGQQGLTPAPRSEPSLLPAAVSHPSHDRTRRLIALLSSLALLVLTIAVGIALSTRRRRAEAVRRQAQLRSGATAGRRSW